MENTQEYQIVRRGNLFPKELEWFYSGVFPNYGTAPEIIDVRNTGLKNFMDQFRIESDQKLVDILKGQTNLSNGELITLNQRKLRFPVWRTEFGKVLTSGKQGQIIVSPLVVGGFEKINFKFKPMEEDSLKFKMEIHSHPSSLVLSQGDVSSIFTGKLSIQIACNDNGYCLAFPTKESPIPQGTDFEDDFWQFGDYGISKRDSESRKIRKIKNARQELLDQLIVQFGKVELSSFFGEKLVERKTDPVEINDKGVALIQLYKLLLLSNKYKVPTYFMEKDGFVFNRLNKVTDIFPELL